MPTLAAARLALALLLLGTVAPACTPSKRMITPTTTGSDLRNLPRGRMIPQPFPGNDLVRSTRRPALDPATVAASTATAIR